MVVDSNAQQANYLAGELERRGYHALTATDVWEGRELAGLRSPVAVVLNKSPQTEEEWVSARALRRGTILIIRGVEFGHDNALPDLKIVPVHQLGDRQLGALLEALLVR